MAKFLVVAPNRKTVTVSAGSNDLTYDHGTFMSNERIAKAYPKVFLPTDGRDNPTETPKTEDEKLEEKVLEEVVPQKPLEEGQEILTEIMPPIKLKEDQVELKEDQEELKEDVAKRGPGRPPKIR